MREPAVAMVHYHLRGGGVTRVIALALSALSSGEAARAVVLTGEAPSPGALPEGARVVVLPELGYASASDLSASGRPRIAEGVRAAATAALGRPPDVWHLHNHCLGKNLSLPVLARELVGSGEKVLLQIHDFAEDWRPAGYRLLRDGCGGDDGELSRLLYPIAANVRYAVLNRRDREALVAAGTPPGLVRVLPNAVREPRRASPEGVAAVRRAVAPTARRLYLYPVRPIRRKNLGEILLHALVAEEGTAFAVTLEPQNPLERPAYERWRSLARELRLPVALAASKKGTLEELMGACDAVLTSSVAEGFGLAFIESWLADRVVRGRNLPEITADFVAAGVDLGGMYERLGVPVEWIGAGELRARVEAALRRTYFTCGLVFGPPTLRKALDAMVHDGEVDFGSLDEELQTVVLRRLERDGLARGKLAGYSADSGAGGDELVRRNRPLILERFGEDRYRTELLGLYAELQGSGDGVLAHVDGRALLEAFLRPERMRLLRT